MKHSPKPPGACHYRSLHTSRSCSDNRLVSYHVIVRQCLRRHPTSIHFPAPTPSHSSAHSPKRRSPMLEDAMLRKSPCRVATCLRIFRASRASQQASYRCSCQHLDQTFLLAEAFRPGPLHYQHPSSDPESFETRTAYRRRVGGIRMRSVGRGPRGCCHRRL